MLQALVKKGRVLPEDVPAPVVSDGSVLIKVVSSCISAGTEMIEVNASRKSLIRRALDQPEKVAKVLNMARSEGIARTYDRVMGKLQSGAPTGYSISGVVIGKGKGVIPFEIGDHVAAAGAGLANHAEYVDVPENLVVKIPSDMDFQAASSVTLGSIAMQGVRRADLRIGEFGVVFGAGILGLLSVQMLNRSGIRVIAIDLDDNRLKIARELGAELIVNPRKEDPVKAVENFTGGFGADAVLFTAATQSSEPLSQSFRMCKRKGKVIIVGVVGMEIKREDMYRKELDLLISTSYGPGRYDAKYEEKGLDYPYAYVRWTENRNMEEYLRLVHRGQIQLDKLIYAVYPIDRVAEAFEALGNSENKPLMVMLDYGKFDSERLSFYQNHDRKVVIHSRPVTGKQVGVALVGAGGFPTGMHLPNMQKLASQYHLHAVVDQAGHRAKEVARQFGAHVATTNIDDVLADPKVDLVMICTRHDSHGGLSLKALQAGKNVFVEKPLCTRQEEVDAFKEFYAQTDGSGSHKPLLMPGFNRRFSAYAREIKKHTDNRVNPLFIHYRMNAGYIPLDNWVHDDGGRIVGEGCHIIDLMTFFTGSQIESLTWESMSPKNEKFSKTDNKSIILKYQDGSVCTIEYFAAGAKEFPKEYMEVHFDEKTIVMDDYKRMSGFGVKISDISTPISQKGHLEELQALHEALTIPDRPWPIELWDMIQTTEISLCIQ